jgi:hypothetical protein
MMYRFKACRKCGGDLQLDDEEWLCCQCGRHYYPRPTLVGTGGRPPSMGRRYGELSGHYYPRPVGTEGRPPAAGGLGRRYGELAGAAGAGRVAVTAAASPS